MVIAKSYSKSSIFINSNDVITEVKTIAEETADRIIEAEIVKIDRIRNEVLMLYSSAGVIEEYGRQISLGYRNKETFKLFNVDTRFLDDVIGQNYSNFHKLIQLMASTDAAGRNSEAYELLLGVLGTEKALSSDEVYYLGNRLRSALNTNSAFKSIQKAEEKRVLEELGKNAVSVGLSISPIGTFKDIAELIYGKDIITQADLSIWDKLLNVIGLDAVKAMKKVTQIAQVAMIIDVAKIADVKVLNSMADTVKLAKMKATGLISKTKMTSNLAKGMGDDLVDIVEEGVSRSKVKMNIQLFAEGTGEAVPISVKILGEGDNLAKVADSIKPLNGYTDIIVHGSDDAFWIQRNGEWISFNQRSMANYLNSSNGYSGGPIRLISCETGSTANGIAQNLANKMGVEVIAPSDTLWVYSNGTMTIGETATSNTGVWKKFLPGNK